MPFRTFLVWLVFFSLSLSASIAAGDDCSGMQKYYLQASKLSNSQPDLIRKTQLYRKVIAICPSAAEPHRLLGNVYERQGRHVEAYREYVKAGELTNANRGRGPRDEEFVSAKADFSQYAEKPLTTRSNPDSKRSSKPESASDEAESVLKLEAGVFYYSGNDNKIKLRTDKGNPPSGLLNYFIYFKPLQDGYVYILQESPDGTSRLIFPTESALVEKDSAIWLPARTRTFVLKAEDKAVLYLLVTSWQLDSPVEGVPLQEVVGEAVKGLMANPVRIEKPAAPVELGLSELTAVKPGEMAHYVERIEGKSGWVRVVTLRAE